MMRFLFLLFPVLLLGACASLSDKPENVPVPVSASWVRELNDPLLNELAAKILTENLDIRTAEARLTEARALRKIERADLFPQVDLAASADYGKRQRTARTDDRFEAGFDANWELDVFGGQRAAVDAASARAEIARLDIETVKQVVVADLARAVTEWRLASEQKAVTEKLLEAQDNQIEIFAAREKAGLSDATLTERARAQRAQSAVQLPQFTAQAKAAQYRIERLMGLPPETMTARLAAVQSALMMPPKADVVLDLPSVTLKQRPDIAAAAAQIDVSRAEIAQAEAALWPSIDLGAFFGLQNASGTTLGDNPVWNLAGTLTTPIFRFGQLRAAIEAADAREKQSLLNYQSVALDALQEVQTALSDYIHGLDAVTKQQEALIRRMDTVQLAQERFTRGIDNMTDLTTAQTEQEQAALNLVQQKAGTVIAYIRLQKALGMPVNGGYETPDAEQTPAQTLPEDSR
jgi:multidrug efflux system outer membrane protein